ncbi:MAG: NfeD family protein [Candidatus Enteromonas sp.]|nr:NfeD family protein [Candidatus Enteromonas sp.]
MWTIWLAIMVAAVVIEAITVDLISVWFVVGAFVSMLISFIPNVPWWVQIVIFAVVSGATLVLLRPFAKRFMDRDLVKTNVDEVVGKKAVVTIDGNVVDPAEVFVDGKRWSAVPANAEVKLEKGDIVVVLSVAGVKLIVEKENE